MVTARSFAARNHYEIDVDREFIALGACNVAAGLSQGFAVTGADSRTAVSDSMGGKTQVTGLVAAGDHCARSAFPHRSAAIPAGKCAWRGADFGGAGSVRLACAGALCRIREGELLVCLAAMLGVVVLGALQGIGLAVGLSLLVLLIRSSRPADALLGRLEGQQGFFDVSAHEGATAVPGVLIYRFAASVIFYNAAYFRRRLLAFVDATPGVATVILDAAPIVHLDSTGADTIADLADRTRARGVRLVIAGALPQVQQMLDRSGTAERLGPGRSFASLRAAVAAHESARMLIDT